MRYRRYCSMGIIGIGHELKKKNDHAFRTKWTDDGQYTNEFDENFQTNFIDISIKGYYKYCILFWGKMNEI